ncbi:MAG: DNA mismatch repair protein MutS, partial [Acidobacteria bacterium]
TSAGDPAFTLFRTLDRSSTPMGKRLLRNWLLRPSLESSEIDSRLEAVATGVRESVAREELHRSLQGILDLERLLSRVTLETANPRDLRSLGASLVRLPGVKAALRKLDSARWRELNAALDELADVRERIEHTLVENPPLTLAEGGVIRAGVDPELDELRGLSRHGKQYLAGLEQRERERPGIASLKVRFNSVFGYYLEISKSNLHLAPVDYDRKQTLVNAERFTTPELKQYEAKILDAEEKIIALERRLFADRTAAAIAELDVTAALAQVAAENRYTRPQFSSNAEMRIAAGRHPVVERLSEQDSSRFIPNDLYLNSSTDLIAVITGPNMGGKSTYLRQAALISIMAQMGSFVPARSARLTMVDRIFTRIGASDNLARGRSTFMMEMTETAAILHGASQRSLILLDEVGRGTSTFDGLAIAWAVVEYLHQHTRAKTLFATHYFELTELAGQLAGVKNFHVAVKETPSGIVFLRKLAPGAADRSYGIEVAKLAGLPAEAIARAREVLAGHEAGGQSKNADGHRPASQLTIFTPLSQPVLEQLRELDLNNITPLAALNLLAELKGQVG